MHVLIGGVVVAVARKPPLDRLSRHVLADETQPKELRADRHELAEDARDPADVSSRLVLVVTRLLPVTSGEVDDQVRVARLSEVLAKYRRVDGVGAAGGRLSSLLRPAVHVVLAGIADEVQRVQVMEVHHFGDVTGQQEATLAQVVEARPWLGRRLRRAAASLIPLLQLPHLALSPAEELVVCAVDLLPARADAPHLLQQRVVVTATVRVSEDSDAPEAAVRR